ncbi:MAG: GMC family oxidoreductase N-terminal domain-containing protein [Acetobacteraceae bacterium]|nr:GMC family oxidoreductase N-terminal domain-containing protein [Acetobacteraceae bacterium]
MADAAIPPSAPRFDIVILGGGSAGCVLAARLSEDPGRRVLLVEAGPDLREGRVPPEIASAYPGRAFFNAGFLWPGLSARMGAPFSNSEPPTERPYEQARILGGGSAINGIGANRGAPADYAEWEAAGARGWGWNDVLPFFRKLESDADFGDDPVLHGNDGPLPIRRVPRAAHTAFIRAVEAALNRQGFVSRADQNGAWEDGVYPIAVNLDAANRRASVATAYLTDAVRRRPNLAIWTGTRARRLIADGRRIIGARLERGGEALEVGAGRVIVSQGALQSPAMLMQSGIGPARHLAAVGVPVLADRAGVGRNLQEHPSIGVSAWLRPGARLRDRGSYHIQGIFRWSSGLEGTAAGDMHTALNTRSGWHAVGSRIGSLFSWVNKSYSRGLVELASPSPEVPPRIDFRLLSDELDLARLAQAFRLAAATMQDAGLSAVVQDVFPSTYSTRVKELLRPTRRNAVLTAIAAPVMDRVSYAREKILAMAQEGTASLELLVADDVALCAHLRRHVGGVWHPCGTCRLGEADDPAAVCAPDGGVIGVEGLSVCDASLMPTIPCANLNVPVLMIAEKISAGLRA